MKTIVFAKQVPDTWSERHLNLETGRLDRTNSPAVIDEIAERAIEVALQYRDSAGGEVVVATMGPKTASETIRKGLEMGADSGLHILDDDLAGADLRRTAAVLAAAARQESADLVIVGNESTDGRAGMVGAMIAEHLGIPHLSNLDEVTIEAHAVVGVRQTDHESQTIRAALPAVISVTERAAEPRVPGLRSVMKAKKKPVTVSSSAQLGVALPSASSLVVRTEHAPGRGPGQIVVDDGSAAIRLAEFLVAARLV